MKSILHKAGTRGHANHGWLNSFHSFSFANYFDPKRMHFGALRVLNDDTVSPGMGFGAHPHDNMEIVSIPLKGELRHKDNTGRESVIKSGDVQIMSAGTGIVHSEMNNSKTDEVKFLQIWVFPKKKNIEPRYDQKTFNPEDRQNQFQVVVSPEEKDRAIWINQDAYFSLGKFDAGHESEYKLHKPGNGLYAFVLNGDLEIGGLELKSRDGAGFSDTEKVQLKANQDSEILLMEIPIEYN